MPELTNDKIENILTANIEELKKNLDLLKKQYNLELERLKLTKQNNIAEYIKYKEEIKKITESKPDYEKIINNINNDIRHLENKIGLINIDIKKIEYINKQIIVK